MLAYDELFKFMETQSEELGFIQWSFAPIDIGQERKEAFVQWLNQGMQGDMHFLSMHGLKRFDPRFLLPEAKSVILVALPYQTESLEESWEVLKNPHKAYVARYALGRDYHKVLRKLLKKLGENLQQLQSDLIFRPVVDSAPLAEVAFANMSGLGFQGKHTLLLNQQKGSLFFIGALLVNMNLPTTEPKALHCGSCVRCKTICPTKAIINDYMIDARRCLSYLTIESKNIVPKKYRKAMGNRIYGCDDCQLICPFNRFSKLSACEDFTPRLGLNNINLVDLLSWDKAFFLDHFAGSPIYRIGYEKWCSNVLIAVGNVPREILQEALPKIELFLKVEDERIREAARWAKAQLFDDFDSLK